MLLLRFAALLARQIREAGSDGRRTLVAIPAEIALRSATASRVRFRYVRGYHAVDITLHWTDSAAVEGQLPIPLDGSWSAWLTASGEEEIVSAILKGGKYANP